MKNFISADDITAIAERGQGELIIQSDMVLTDLARRSAESMGVRLVEPGQAAVTIPPAGLASHPPAAAVPLGGKPKSCMSRPAQPGAAVAAPMASGNGSSQVVDQLVSAIKRRGSQTNSGQA